MISTRPVACKFHRKCDLSLRERAKRVRVADERGEGHLCMHYVALVGALAALRWRDELEHVTAPLAGELAEHCPNVLLRRTKLHSHQRLEQRWRRTLGSGRQRLRARLAQRIGCGALGPSYREERRPHAVKRIASERPILGRCLETFEGRVKFSTGEEFSHTLRRSILKAAAAAAAAAATSAAAAAAAATSPASPSDGSPYSSDPFGVGSPGGGGGGGAEGEAYVDLFLGAGGGRVGTLVHERLSQSLTISYLPTWPRGGEGRGSE